MTTSKIETPLNNEASKALTVAEHLVKRIANDGIDKVFGVVGGGIMYLVDAIARSRDVFWVACHHEEFAGISAQGYALAKKPYGVSFGTTGPGATHLFTAVAAAWQDSVPSVYIVGQVKSQDSSSIQELKLRQNGTFEFDSLESFRPIAKRVSILKSANDFPEELELSIAAAITGRPGPVLIEIPLDLQKEFVPLCEDIDFEHNVARSSHDLSNTVETMVLENALVLLRERLSKSLRPLVLLGTGAVRSDCHQLLTASLDTAGIPYVVTQLAREAGNLEHDYYLGSPGIKANRSANSAMAECDLLIAIGTSLHQQVIGWDHEQFTELPSYKVWFEIDPDVVASRKHLVDVAITSPTNQATSALLSIIDKPVYESDHSPWLQRCSDLRRFQLLHYPAHEVDENSMCLYRATTLLSDYASDYSAACTDAGIVWYTMAQHYFPVSGTSYISSGSFGSMGMALPYAIGAASATNKRVLAMTGDGSIMMCLPELATLRDTQLPVVLVINSNGGYRSIRATQDRYFDGRHLGTDDKSGLFIPNFSEVANTFGIDYFEARNADQLNFALEEVRDSSPKPVIIEVFTYEDQAVEPLIESRLDDNGKMVSGGLANMFPDLPIGN